MSCVGSIRINEAVTRTSFVRQLFAKYPKNENFDIIELFNKSVPNDPSPPSKAISVLHRSTSTSVPIATTVFTKILDYNNRDFYKWQMNSIVEDISSQWLRECGGGFWLNIHRDPETTRMLENENLTARINRYLNRNRNRVDRKSVEVSEKSSEINGERKLRRFCEMRFFYDFKNATFDDCDKCLTIFHIDNLRRIVYTNLSDSSRVVVRSELGAEMQRILRETNCLEGVVLFSNEVDENEFNFYHAFTVNLKPVETTITTDVSIPIHYKHLIS